MAGAFQSNAFQNTAFQCDTGGATSAPNALRRLIQSDYAREQRLSDRNVLQTMFGDLTTQQKIQLLRAEDEQRLIEEDDETILRLLGP